jgi:hypothetical protein
MWEPTLQTDLMDSKELTDAKPRKLIEDDKRTKFRTEMTEPKRVELKIETFAVSCVPDRMDRDDPRQTAPRIDRRESQYALFDTDRTEPIRKKARREHDELHCALVITDMSDCNREKDRTESDDPTEECSTIEIFKSDPTVWRP